MKWMPRSRLRRSPSKGAPGMANFKCKELRVYSPTHFIVPADYYLPAPCYCSLDQCFLHVPNMNSDPYGPYAVQLYTPPAAAAVPKAVHIPSPIPISVIYSPPFMIPPYHDPYGPTALQIYSPYIPPVVKRRSIRDVIGLGQDSDLPLPCRHSEGTQFPRHPMLSAPPAQSVNFSAVSPHYLVCPVLGLFLMVALGVYALFWAFKKLRHHEPEAEADDEEYHSAPSSLQEISGLEHNFLKKDVKRCSQENEGWTRYERPNARMESRSNYPLCSGFPIKSKFATKKRRLTSVPPETKLAPTKRRFSDFSTHFYQLDVLWSSHNESSIAGTFALYCTLYSALKRRRCHMPDVDDFHVGDIFSDPSPMSHTKFKEYISELYSYDPPLIDPQNVNVSLSKGNQMCVQADVHNTECGFEEFCAKPSNYDDPGDHFQQEEECDGKAKDDNSKYGFEEFAAKPSICDDPGDHFQQEEECDRMSKNDNTECCFEEFTAKPSIYDDPGDHFQQEEECDHMAKNDESFEHIVERLNDHLESRMDDHSSINIADEVNAQPPDLLVLNENPSTSNFQNDNVAFVEGDQIRAQNTVSEDVGNQEFKDELLIPSYSSSSMELSIVESNNAVEKECHNIHESGNLIVSQSSTKKLWCRSGQQHCSSRWYIATGMGKRSRHW